VPPWSDFDPLLCGSAVLGLIIALVYLGALLRRGHTPQLARFLEIILSAIGIGTAFALWRLAWVLPTESGPGHFKVTQLDRLYLFVGAFPLIWIALETIIRRFKADLNSDSD
jgi:hypothetical protein